MKLEDDHGHDQSLLVDFCVKFDSISDNFHGKYMTQKRYKKKIGKTSFRI